MKKLTAMLLALTLAASLSLTAFAEEPEAPEVPAEPEPAAAVRVWGKVTPWDAEEGVYLTNDDEDDPMRGPRGDHEPASPGVRDGSRRQCGG